MKIAVLFLMCKHNVKLMCISILVIGTSTITVFMLDIPHKHVLQSGQVGLPLFTLQYLNRILSAANV